MQPPDSFRNAFWCEDALVGAPRRLPEGCADLVITDPPYGIQGDKLHRHYNRDESQVVAGYVEVAARDYADFTRTWIAQAARVLRPGGSLFAVSGYTQLPEVLMALRGAGLREVNHIIWKFNFGVHTKRKFVSSHYHVLYYEKPGARRTFNRFSRFGSRDKTEGGRSRQYADLEDVWCIRREFKPGQRKNKNQLPLQLLAKIIQYASDPGDLVVDLFLGSFATAIAAKGLGRDAAGFELNADAFSHGLRTWEDTPAGFLAEAVPHGRDDRPARAGAPMDAAEVAAIVDAVEAAVAAGDTKRSAIEAAMAKHERGYWAIQKVLKAARGR